MNSPEIPESDPIPSAPTANVDTGAIGKAIQVLLSSNILTDPTDKRIIGEATQFLESSAEPDNLSEITKQASAVAEVMSGFDMQGIAVPRAIDFIYLKLTVLEYRHHVNTVKVELAKSSPDKVVMQQPMRLALGVAKILAKGYENASYLTEVQALQLQIDQL
jgi:hypothetical protein